MVRFLVPPPFYEYDMSNDISHTKEDFTMEFIYDLHTLVGIDGPTEFAKMLLEYDTQLYKDFCKKLNEYNETKYWETVEKDWPR